MAENVTRDYEVILKELFFGKDAALDKYAKVRRAFYEIQLWKKYGLPLSLVDKTAKVYFSKRFLSGKRIDAVSKPEFNKALDSLGYAAGIDPDGNSVESGCRLRCHKLVAELNVALEQAGLITVHDADEFLDLMTYSYDFVLDDNGKPKFEPGYRFEIRVFHSDENRLWFRKELENLFRQGLRMPMQAVYEMARYRRKYAKPRPKPPKTAPNR